MKLQDADIGCRKEVSADDEEGQAHRYDKNRGARSQGDSGVQKKQRKKSSVGLL